MIVSVARHGRTPIGDVAEWDIDELLAYHAAISRVIKAERPKTQRTLRDR